MNNKRTGDTNGFTLIELLVVVAILGILSAAVTIVLNPIELLAESRDAERISDMESLSKSLSLYQVQNPSAMPGTSNTVYISIADASSTCGGLGLPTLPSGWTYGCSANPKKADSTGWIPVNLSSIASSNISALPLDPVNSVSSGLYYTYVVNGDQYEVTSFMESRKYKLKEETNPPLQYYPGVLAEGSSISISPLFNSSGLVGYWNFDEGSGSTAYDISTNSDNGTWQGTLGSQWSSGKVGNYSGNFNGTNNYVSMSFPAFTGDFTQVSWDYITTLTANAPLAFTQSGANQPFPWMRVNGNLVECLWNNGSWQQYYSVSTLPTNSWVQIACTYSSSDGEVRIYINGALNSTTAGSAPNASGPITGYIGRNDQDAKYFPGMIDDVRVYNRALSPAEIQALYNSQI